MSKLPKFDFDPKVLVGLDTSDDAAVYAVTDDTDGGFFYADS